MSGANSAPTNPSYQPVELHDLSNNDRKGWREHLLPGSRNPSEEDDRKSQRGHSDLAAPLLSAHTQQAALRTDGAPEIHREAESDKKYAQDEPHRTTWFSRFSNDTWAWEILSCLVAVVFLAASIIVLKLYDGRPTTDWEYSISINAILAIFTRILGAALVVPIAEGISAVKWHSYRVSQPLLNLEALDAASRGPMGALFLLFKRHTNFLSLFGALLTILLLGVDAFSQQVTQYQDCLRESTNHSVAIIPRTYTYDAYGLDKGPGVSKAIDTPMAFGINRGLLFPVENPSSLLSTQCDTGNCTFGTNSNTTYTTLSVCHSCADLTSEVRDTTTGNQSWYNFNFSLPNSGMPGFGSRDLFVDGVRAMAVTNSSWLHLEPELRTDSLFSMKFLMLQFNESELGSATQKPDAFGFSYNKNGSKPRASAFSCSLTPCAATYTNVGVVNRELRETLAFPPQPLKLAFTAGDFPYYALLLDRALRNNTWLPCERSVTNRTTGPENKWVNFYNSTPEELGGDTTRSKGYYPRECVLEMTLESVSAIGNYLDTFFRNGVIRGEYSSNKPDGLVQLMTLWRNGGADLESVDRYWKGLADSMSATIREQGEFGKTVPLRGSAMVRHSCLKVRWRWMSFPIAIVVLTVVFLVASMIVMRNEHVKKGWKSSALPMLFSEVSMGEGVLRVPEMRKSELSKLANEVRITVQGGRTARV